ncbi:hypothetical protein Tco_0478846 [Tanacetum coccineum]
MHEECRYEVLPLHLQTMPAEEKISQYALNKKYPQPTNFVGLIERVHMFTRKIWEQSGVGQLVCSGGEEITTSCGAMRTSDHTPTLDWTMECLNTSDSLDSLMGRVMSFASLSNLKMRLQKNFSILMWYWVLVLSVDSSISKICLLKENCLGGDIEDGFLTSGGNLLMEHDSDDDVNEGDLKCSRQ